MLKYCTFFFLLIFILLGSSNAFAMDKHELVDSAISTVIDDDNDICLFDNRDLIDSEEEDCGRYSNKIFRKTVTSPRVSHISLIAIISTDRTPLFILHSYYSLLLNNLSPPGCW